MNIFAIHTSTSIAATWHVDRHVIKMPLEAAQMLSTAIRVTIGTKTVLTAPNGKKKTVFLLPNEVYNWQMNVDKDGIVTYKILLSTGLYVQSHINHPCNIWARECYENFEWLWNYMMELGFEYHFRYAKDHKSIDAMLQADVLQYGQDCLPKCYNRTPFATAMDAQYIVAGDPIASYKNYYKFGKKHLHKWTKRPVPEFIGE